MRRLRRAERREQILAAATRAFARAGFAATSLDDIAAEAGITRVILYRHFGSKAEMYRAVLDRADSLTAASAEVARHDLARQIPPGPWLDWAARLIPALTIEAVIAWLDAGQPDPAQAPGRIAQAVHGAIQAAQSR